MRKIFSFLLMPWESVKMSVSNILHNRLRSFLTMLGIMIGVAAVIALITTISGVSDSISDSFTSMGAGRLMLNVSGSELKDGLTQENIAEIASLAHVEGVTPGYSFNTAMIYNKKRNTGISVAGVNDYWFTTQEDLSKGRTITSLDTSRMNRVCLVGQDALSEFFYGINPLGQTVYLNGIEFTVVGILPEEYTGSDLVIPYTTALKMNSKNVITSLTLYLDDTENKESVQKELETLLDAMFYFEDDTYTISTMEAVESTMEELLGMMSTLLAGIASIALVVGGIGIMNMMLTSVTERTSEIGLKKALGAKPGQIQFQFLLESVMLSLLGGLMGVLLGLGISFGMCRYMNTDFRVSVDAIALGAGFSAGIGIIFGWAPARKASRLNPIDALRSA